MIDDKIKISISDPLISWNQSLTNENKVLFVINSIPFLTEDDGQFLIPDSITNELTANEELRISLFRGTIKIVEGLNGDLHKIYALTEARITGVAVL